MAISLRSSSSSRIPSQPTAVRSNDQRHLHQEQGLCVDSLSYMRPEMAYPHRNGKKLFEEIHSDVEPILKTAKSGEKRKSAIKRRSLHGTKRVSFASELSSKRPQLLDPSLANPGLTISSQRTLVPHWREKRLSCGPGRRRSALMINVASRSDSSPSDEASVSMATLESEDQRVPVQFEDDSELNTPSRACYSDFVRHNTMKRNGLPPVDLHGTSSLRRATVRRRSLLVPGLQCKVQADQHSHTRRKHQRLQDISSEALS
ncbi:hypothetical protein EC968_002290 [Mortierella alpina]|nr:hypothetical protein EC968_002290 [Mortierella alpina]